MTDLTLDMADLSTPEVLMIAVRCSHRTAMGHAARKVLRARRIDAERLANETETSLFLKGHHIA